MLTSVATVKRKLRTECGEIRLDAKLRKWVHLFHFFGDTGEGVDENFGVKLVNSYFHGSARFDGVGRIVLDSAINIANDEEIMRSSNSIRKQICNFRRIHI